MLPTPGAVNASVPKNVMGMAFWIEGVPGMPLSVKVAPPSSTAAGMKRLGVLELRRMATATGYAAKITTSTDTPP